MITPASKFWKGPAPIPPAPDWRAGPQQGKVFGYRQRYTKNRGPRHNNGSERENARRCRQIKRGSLTAANGLTALKDAE